MKSRVVLGIALAMLSLHATAGVFTSDGGTYEECMMNRIDQATTTNQYIIVAEYCRQKHPLPQAPAQTAPEAVAPDPAGLVIVQGTDPSNAIARPVIAKLDLTQAVLTHDGQMFGNMPSPDFRWYERLDVTNRNSFPISALVVGLPSRDAKRCAWDAKQYAQIYQCDGYAEGGMSGSFKCYIPDVEKRRVNFCVVGLGIYGTNADVNRYLPHH